MYTPEIGTALEDLDTPCLVIDLDVMEKNISGLLASAKKAGVSVRPHMKTTKSPGLARILIEGGASGICVAKLSEAEVMIEAGVDDVLITTEIVGEPKCTRLASLAARTSKLRVVIDSEEAAVQINEHMKKANRPLLVLIDLNVGQDRCGVEDQDAALKLAQAISKLDHLQIVGIQGYEGHLQMMADEKERRRLCHESMKKLVAAAEHLRANGFDIQTVTTGGTGTFSYCAEVKGVTEVQPGSFVFMDVSYGAAGVKEYGQSLHVLSSVISKPVSSRAVIDAGLKSLSTDSGNAKPHSKWGHLNYRPAGDEHGILEAANGKELNVSIGDKVLLVPSHIDTTVNLHDNYCCMRNNKLESFRRISARGKVQ